MKKVYLKTEFIENYLLYANKNFKWLKEQLNISQEYLSLLLHKKRALSPSIREKFIKLFGAEFNDLFLIEEN